MRGLMVSLKGALCKLKASLIWKCLGCAEMSRSMGPKVVGMRMGCPYNQSQAFGMAWDAGPVRFQGIWDCTSGGIYAQLVFPGTLKMQRSSGRRKMGSAGMVGDERPLKAGEGGDDGAERTL